MFSYLIAQQHEFHEKWRTAVASDAVHTTVVTALGMKDYAPPPRKNMLRRLGTTTVRTPTAMLAGLHVLTHLKSSHGSMGSMVHHELNISQVR